MTKSISAIERRKQLKEELWPTEIAWTGEKVKGWFKAPRTLPLILAVMGEKGISGNQDPAPAYLELFSRHMGQGIIEMEPEEDHAFAAGYEGTRGTRTWRERMKILQNHGFIQVKPKGNRQFGYILIVHPALVLERLHDKGLVRDVSWETYRTRRIETKEASPKVQTLKQRAQPKVVPLRKKKA